MLRHEGFTQPLQSRDQGLTSAIALAPGGRKTLGVELKESGSWLETMLGVVLLICET